MATPKPRAYARALYEAALESNLDLLREVARKLSREGLPTRLDDAALSFQEKQAEIDPVLGADVDPRVRNLVYTLAADNDLSLLDEVLDDYEELLRGGVLPVQLATVTSAVELSGAQREEVQARLRGRFGEELEVRFQVDPEILAGLVVRVGDQVLDGSIRGRLESLRAQLRTAG